MATGVIRAINSGINMAFTIPASSWTSTAPYTYSWLNSKVTDDSHITVEFYSTNVNTETPYLEYEKISGGIQFTVPSKPSTDISVIAHIISAQDGPYANIDGTMVATDAITGAANTTEALSALNATKAASPTLLSDVGPITTSTTLTYTGKKVTVPAGSIYFIRGWGIYGSSRCTGVVISTDSDPSHYYNYQATYLNNTQAVSCCGYAAVASTFYLHAQFAAATTNQVGIQGAYIKL